MQDFAGLDRQVWHTRYLVQAGWTDFIRQHLFEKINPRRTARILEIGCGTGAILESLLNRGFGNLTGVDIDAPSLSFAKTNPHPFKLIQADGNRLPFHQGGFDLSLCHYLLMWTHSPDQMLKEMTRVTKTGGWVMALAEPDHEARIDYPPPLEELGKHQTRALKNQGVDARMGRRLRAMFHAAGLSDVEAGLLGAEWQGGKVLAGDETEWRMLQSDLKGRLTRSELDAFQSADQRARESGERILFIPTFYAIGRVP